MTRSSGRSSRSSSAGPSPTLCWSVPPRRKTKIVEDIARRIALGDALIPDQLKDYTIYELPITNIIAGTGIVGSLEEKVKAIVEFASDPKNKAILFMDEIHQITGGPAAMATPSAARSRRSSSRPWPAATCPSSARPPVRSHGPSTRTRPSPAASPGSSSTS
ncbi:AAA family ATPase [Streptomyces sp. FXJ1.4098]|nr:AAA family ATPase [Streptomyces sp. FXJ1.4098]